MHVINCTQYFCLIGLTDGKISISCSYKFGRLQHWIENYGKKRFFQAQYFDFRLTCAFFSISFSFSDSTPISLTINIGNEINSFQRIPLWKLVKLCRKLYKTLYFESLHQSCNEVIYLSSLFAVPSVVSLNAPRLWYLILNCFKNSKDNTNTVRTTF